jgi:hypothetical protein
VLIVGDKEFNSIDDPVLNGALMSCFLEWQNDEQVIIHSRIFEIRISK